jgi:lipopolysaccharide export LptBFGC system permease protein LptF
MAGPHVFEIDPGEFRLVRHIGAASAKWEPGVGQWVFQDGWQFEYDGYRVRRFEQFKSKTFPDLPETPEYFLTEKKQEQQLNFLELEDYIRELRQSGFDTVRMRVQYHRKFSVPMFVWIMALIAVPFSFLTGNRGAMAGVGASIGIAIAYFAIGRLFAEIGNVNQLAAPVAAWAPDVVFAVAGLYFFTRMRS